MSPLKGNGEALEQKYCLSAVLGDKCDPSANLLNHFNSHLVPCPCSFNGNWEEEVSTRMITILGGLIIIIISQNHRPCLLTLPFVANVCRGAGAKIIVTPLSRAPAAVHSAGVDNQATKQAMDSRMTDCRPLRIYVQVCITCDC